MNGANGLGVVMDRGEEMGQFFIPSGRGGVVVAVVANGIAAIIPSIVVAIITIVVIMK